MSCYLILNSWDGQNRDAAATRLARMFRMREGQAYAVLEQLDKGEAWRFIRRVSDQQAQVAENYLTGLGFEVGRGDAAMSNAPETVATAVGLAEPPADYNPVADADYEDDTSSNGGKTVDESSPQTHLPIGFHGRGMDLARIMLANWVLTVLTLGIYYFWGKTKTRRYLFEQSSFAGDRFCYHGTGAELFRGWMVFVLLVSVLVGGVIAAQNYLGPEIGSLLESALTLGFVVMFPALMVGAYRYRLSRSSWRGIRFSFRGARKEAVAIYVKSYFLIPLTLGLYTPFFMMNMQRFWASNSYFGNKHFDFTGEGRDIFKKFLVSIPLSILTMGLYTFWYQAYVARYTWSHTHIAGGTFRFDASGGDMAKLHIGNFLLLVITAGLAFPWVMVRNRRFVADHLCLEGRLNLERVVQEMQNSRAIGEGALDAFDIPLNIV